MFASIEVSMQNSTSYLYLPRPWRFSSHRGAVGPLPEARECSRRFHRDPLVIFILSELPQNGVGLDPCTIVDFLRDSKFSFCFSSSNISCQNEFQALACNTGCRLSVTMGIACP